LTINDNVIGLNIRPGAREGDLAVLSLNPALEYYQMENRVRTIAAGGERRIHFDRLPGSLHARLWGTIPLRDRPPEMLIAIEDPAQYAAAALRRALEDRGIVVEGASVSEHRLPADLSSLTQGSTDAALDGQELARRVSAPLLEDLRITDKVSQNLHAELDLRAVGRARRGVGSFEAGHEEMKTFFTEAGMTAESYRFLDGSGLARQNLVTPAAIVKLLRFMYASPARESWLSLLPVGARDGTLANRFTETPAAERVFAKTGSLSHVSALSGYIHRQNGEWVAFSIVVNNYNAPTAEIRGVMDRICNLIVE